MVNQSTYYSPYFLVYGRKAQRCSVGHWRNPSTFSTIDSWSFFSHFPQESVVLRCQLYQCIQKWAVQYCLYKQGYTSSWKASFHPMHSVMPGAVFPVLTQHLEYQLWPQLYLFVTFSENKMFFLQTHLLQTCCRWKHTKNFQKIYLVIKVSFYIQLTIMVKLVSKPLPKIPILRNY